MLEKFQLNRPTLCEVPSAIRLLSVAQQANRFIELAPVEMSDAGLFASSREGIWMYLAEESLRPLGIKLSFDQETTLIDLFSILRRIYKSADDAWDQSQQVRDYISGDPLSRVMGPLRWNHQGVENVTHLSPLFEYLNLRLAGYFPNDEEKMGRIRSVYESFVTDAVFALVDFERLHLREQPEWRECFDYYGRTTGRIGESIGSIVNEIIDGDKRAKQILQTNFKQAALVSQLADDIRDLPLDVVDTRSPSAIKALLRLVPEEYESLLKYAQRNTSHISYRIFKHLAPKTANIAEKLLYFRCISGLPKNIQRFLRDFYYTLPPMAVSHKDPLNKDWHTHPKADQRVSTYVNRKPEEAPYKLVGFIELDDYHEGGHLAMLIDPGKQPNSVVSQQVQEFLDQGGKVLLIGGSNLDNPSSFQETVDTVIDITRGNQDISVIIFPGHISQIPQNGEGIKGILNYRYILGSPNSNYFGTVFPQEARSYVEKILKERGIRSIPTLYVLCGDPKSSVSQVTGICPINLQQADQASYFFQNIEKWLKNGVACIYLEGGSGSSCPITAEIVHETKKLISKYSPRTLLFVGGGINNPKGVSAISRDSDCIVIGTHFETSKASDTKQFLSALRQ
jgi:geranylgeranylglyceryl phosphate synthase family protein